MGGHNGKDPFFFSGDFFPWGFISYLNLSPVLFSKPPLNILLLGTNFTTAVGNHN